MECHMTFVGTATLILEVGGLRFITDPVFDPPGTPLVLGKTGLVTYTALREPALAVDQVGAIDAVLLSHDHHGDNLDRTGRTLLPRAGRVVTTPAGSRRLSRRGLDNVQGLEPWEDIELHKDGFHVRVTAMPARHGPPLTRWLTGDVTGFLLEWSGQEDGALYISGDTRLYSGIHRIAERYRIGTAILHLGAARFAATGPLRYSMSGDEAAAVARLLEASRVIPVHYDGWTHFRENVDAVKNSFRRAGLAARLLWPLRGEAMALSV